jgi:1-deoxy-D-xylulose-5-phosphate reductoisomerase
MKNIAVLGISGSVGESTVKVLRQFSKNFRLTAFSVHSNWKRAEELIKEFKPDLVCISESQDGRKPLGDSIAGTRIVYGEEGMEEIASHPKVDCIVTAVVGAVGVKPTIVAIQAGKEIAIANKETLVTFGPLINHLLTSSPSKLIPVDSEHNALFQLLESKKKESIRSIILTASGGSFRNLPIEKLPYVTVEQALKHPTWTMGPKITVDSAGLVNKGLEVIEAHFLFGYSYDQISVVIHPQSIIHGLVENIDGAVEAYASHPDMIFPVAHSLFYPEYVPELLIERRPFSWKELSFLEPDDNRYPALALAYQAGRKGGTAPAIFNAANEMACSLFLEEKISFIDIPMLLAKALDQLTVDYPRDLEGYLYADKEARDFVSNHYQSSLSSSQLRKTLKEQVQGALPC